MLVVNNIDYVTMCSKKLVLILQKVISTVCCCYTSSPFVVVNNIKRNIIYLNNVWF